MSLTSKTDCVHTPGSGGGMQVIAQVALPLMLALTSCSSVPLTESGTLSSYNSLGDVKGIASKSRTFVDGPYLLSHRTISITPTKFSDRALSRVAKSEDRDLVANAVDRAMCIALSDKYEVLPTGQLADLKVQAVITDIVPTDKFAAGVSKVASIGSSAFLPVGVPRLPIGLGGLAMEAEVLDENGVQHAAIVWSKGANSFTSSPRVSEIGDAYSLAVGFSNHFSRVLVTGQENPGLSLPSRQSIRSSLGGRPKNAVCDAYGRAPGLAGFVSEALGGPPSWTDRAPAH